jgi:hypothetical protein
MDEREWEFYLISRGLYDGDLRSSLLKIECQIAEVAPEVRGMIWRNGSPVADARDVDAALRVLGVANFDSLGPPDDPEYIGTPFKQMFISQEDSKANETDPSKNQNQGRWQSDVPEKPDKTNKPKQQKMPADIDERMQELANLLEQAKK